MDAVFHCSHGAIFSDEQYRYTRTFVYPEYTIAMHTHGFYELNVVLRGEGVHFIEDMTCKAFSGCVFLIPPDVRHGYVSHNNLTVFHLVLHRDFLKECFSEFQKTAGFSLLFETEPFLRAHYEESLFPVLTPEEQQILLQDIAAIDSCRNTAHGSVYADAFCKKILCQLCLLMEQRHGVQHYSPCSGKDPGVILDCLNYIHQNFSDSIHIDFLARRANMSRSTFIRQFTQACGCPPHRYINNYRLTKARELLSAAEESLTAAAAKCGFYDASHLRRQLKEKGGQ